MNLAPESARSWLRQRKFTQKHMNVFALTKDSGRHASGKPLYQEHLVITSLTVPSAASVFHWSFTRIYWSRSFLGFFRD